MSSPGSGIGEEITGTVNQKREFQDLNHRLSLLLAQQNFLLEASAAANEADKAAGMDNEGLSKFYVNVEEENRRLIDMKAKDDATIELLKKELARLKMELDALRADLTRAQGEAANWKADAGSALNRIRGLEDEIAKLKRELAATSGGNSEVSKMQLILERERTEHEKTKQRFAMERAMFLKDIDGLKNELAEQKKINLDMNAQFMADKANFENAQKKCMELQLQIQSGSKASEAWKEDLQRQYEAMFNKMKLKLSADLDRYKVSLKKEYGDQIQKMAPIDLTPLTRAGGNGMEAMNADLRAKVDKYREDNQQLILQVAELQKKLEQSGDSSSELMALKDKNQKLELQVAQLQAKLSAAMDRVRQMEMDHTQQLRVKDDNIRQLRQQIKELLSRLQGAQAKAISLASEFRVYRQMLKEGEHTLDVPFPDRKRRRRSSYMPSLELSTYCVPLGMLILHNGTSQSKKLSGWSLKTENGRHTVQLPNFTLKAGETFKILTREDNRNKNDLKANEMMWPVDLSNCSLMLCSPRGDVVSTLPIAASEPDKGTWSIKSMANWKWF